MAKILVVNIGSSSIKFALYDKTSLVKNASGIAERIGLDHSQVVLKAETAQTNKVDLPDHSAAVVEILKIFKAAQLIKSDLEIEMVGFRTIIAGPSIKEACLIDEKLFQAMEDYAFYVPLHNPVIAKGIKDFARALPHAQLSANFDTAFHYAMPKLSYTYGINKEFAKKHNLRKYGFHGTSYQYINWKLQTILNKKQFNAIVLHIGNGVTVTAIKDNQSLDTSIGLSSIGGAIMGTRSGDIDPGMHEIVRNKTGLSVQEFTEILTKKSGLLGLSGVSSDLRDLMAAIDQGNTDAKFALELYCQRLTDYVALYINKLEGKVGAIVFTGGVGENSAFVRELVLSKIFVKKIILDSEANLTKYADYNLITTSKSEVSVYAIRTDEELMIAMDAKKLFLKKS